MRDFALGNKGGYTGGQGMDAIIGELPDIGKKFMPEMLLSFCSSADGIKGFLGHLPMLHTYGPIVNKGLESLSTFALEHHLQLLPDSALVISLISINVEGLQVI